MGKGFYFEVIEMFWSSIEVVVVQYYEYHRVVYFKMIKFMFCEFHLNKLFEKKKP